MRAGVPLKRIAELRADRRRNSAEGLLTLDVVESGTGRLVADPWETPALPEASGIADVDPGDVLFGKLRPYLAKVVHVTRPAYASTELLCLRPAREIDSRWLFYRMIARPTVEWSISTSEGSKMPRTSWERLGEFRVDVPGLGAQRAIADYLDTETARVDALIGNKQQLASRLQQRRWLYFLHRLEPETPPVVPLRRAVVNIVDGPFGSAFSSADYVDEGVGLIRLGNIGFAQWRGDELVYLPEKRFADFRAHSVRQGDLLIAALGDANNHAGRACVAPDLGKAIVKGKCFRAIVDTAVADPFYLALFCSSPSGADAIATEARGSTRSMINLDIVKSMPIRLPTLKTQSAIVADTFANWAVSDRLLDRLTSQIALLQEHRRALITASVSGELQIPGVAS